MEVEITSLSENINTQYSKGLDGASQLLLTENSATGDRSNEKGCPGASSLLPDNIIPSSLLKRNSH